MTATTDVGPVPATRTTQGAPRKKRRERGGAVLGLLAWLVGLLFVLPVLWMVLTSLHSEPDAAAHPPAVFAPPAPPGYRAFFGGVSPWPPLLNSLTAAVLSTILVLLLSIPAAYAL